MHDNLIINAKWYKLHIFQCTQPSNHSSIERRTNYGAKFNFIGIKKTGRVPNFFFKSRQCGP